MTDHDGMLDDELASNPNRYSTSGLRIREQNGEWRLENAFGLIRVYASKAEAITGRDFLFGDTPRDV